jgi:predicted transposase/invertase (TIGR01784 family)
MVKFRRGKNKDLKNGLCQWLTYFDVNVRDEELREVIKMNTAIQKAEERFDFVTRDKDFLRDYHRRAMEMSDWTTSINTATEIGKIEVAVNLKKKGMPAAEIVEVTGLDIETIQSL